MIAAPIATTEGITPRIIVLSIFRFWLLSACERLVVVAEDGFLPVPTPPQAFQIIIEDNEVGLVLLVFNDVDKLALPGEPIS